MSQNKKKKRIYTKTKTKGINDLSWYNNYPELSSGMVGANFVRRKGISEPISTSNTNVISSVASFGVKLDIIPKTKGDAYRTAMHKLFTALRSANTGSLPYNIKQLQAYFYDLRQILAQVRSLRRAYAVLPKFDLMDKTLPISIFKAMGYDYDSFVANAADLRNELNYISTQLHTLLPGKNDLLERTCWMFDNVFKDSDDVKAQLYLMRAPSSVLLLDGSATPTSSTVGNLTSIANAPGTTGATYSTVMTSLRMAVGNVLNQDVFNIIAADLLKCFGTSQIAYFDFIDENYTINYVYSEEVLTQIQNARLKEVSMSYGWDGNYFKTDLTFTGFDNTGSITVSGAKTYVNMFKNDISNLDLLGATRFAWTCEPASNGFSLTTFGTEILEDMYIIGHKPYGDTSTYAYDLYGRSVTTFLTGAVTGPNTIAETLTVLSQWATFDWAPMIQITAIAYYDNSGSLTDFEDGAYPIWDFNNYAIVEESQLDSYHDIAVLSLLYNPSLVKNVNLITIK